MDDKDYLKSIPGFDLVPQDMRDALDRFSDEAMGIVHGLLRVLESEEPPPIIYHYTNEAGLRGILQSGQLWLTDIFSLNDPTELSHGFSNAVKVLNDKLVNRHPVGRVFAENFAVFYKQGAIQKVAHFFVCAFSVLGNDLGQWRTYADNGRGYALAFDAKTLEDGFTKKDGIPILNNSTFHVRYNDRQLSDIQGQIIEKMLDLIMQPKGRGLQNSVINTYMMELQMRLTFNILQTILFFKHEGYDHEKEYRFLQIHRADMPPPDVKVSPRLAKYREFDWRSVAAGSLKEIVVGPAADRAKAAQVANDCLCQFHSGAVSITYSGIPYRAM
jgi:hypothetical protein